MCLVTLPQTENKANSIVHAVKAHVEYTNEVSAIIHDRFIKSYSALLVASYCALLCVDSVLAEKVGQRKVGGVTLRALCTQQLIDLAI